MIVGELRKFLRDNDISDDAEVMLHDSDLGEDYQARRVSIGFARDTKYESGSGCWVFDKSPDSLNVSLKDMQTYYISEYKIHKAIQIT